jgi:hypothetical protein
MHALLSNAADPASQVTETPGLVADLSIPLVLDLDGTLLRTDTLQESLIIYLKRGGYGIFENRPPDNSCDRCRSQHRGDGRAAFSLHLGDYRLGWPA